MSQRVKDLLGGATPTITGAAPATTAVELLAPRDGSWLLELEIQGLAGDGGDACIPILQTSYDRGTTWWDVASGASIAGGVVAAARQLIHVPSGATAPARKAVSDGVLAASTINLTLLGDLVRIKGGITDGDSDGQWRLNRAVLWRW